ncbi:DUF1800 domain-containing protein [Kineococcus gynurae]|uniref:DUF1800 domain-containing protein n=1 Tax=Kineococcus gynurae TaxID=452979 RepID=A0ABV5LNN9_9ACTN
MVDTLLHLVRRTTWGPTPGLLEEVAAVGPARWLEQQLDPSRIPDEACDRFLTLFPKLNRTLQQVRAQERWGDARTMQQLSYATIGRYCWSRRQLFEVMCDFWSNHLNVTNTVPAFFADRHDYDATVVRPHALGRFADMLLASSRHPAMLRYLDGGVSRKEAPNQNYGREVLELHTLGIDGGYTETDMKACARVMTGWCFRGDGTAIFDPRRHDAGAVRVAGWSAPDHDPASGPQVQADLLLFLARHPSTARSLATKLVRRFVSDDPQPDLVAQLARVYLDNDTAVAPVLRALFASPAFAASAGTKTRRPLEGLVAAVRALGAQPGRTGAGGADAIFIAARGLGHGPLLWPAPNGFPDVATAWSSAGSTMRRWNATWELTSRRKPDNLVWPENSNLATRIAGCRTWGQFLARLVATLLFRPATQPEIDALLRLCGRSSETPLSENDPWLAQRLGDLSAIVLCAPGHMER